ncbi:MULTISPECIES: acyltransferase [unclassified Bradyrhizobium]|uniref:acyltransferase family protein n=1 Tax=unclassified Bradyrhizobium TaxID=2631580 RepID=UPI002A0EA425|nr:acyltransferase [Bradyrhizobium sp. 84]MCK1346918.1 acyltransferase [Bradyrhizobium sp. CW11]MCK1372855.1 acyltransferase [Bradyrhizobium sp. 49]MCK1427426.1 acyltransferase [Bradyrhizobium sp. 87]MCK1438446.1 acyltransferase [Bradyrhizobium sp. 15]MCK1540058.1 acyltransferase [Bradyrhizobium sp. 176]MCK1551255.1 acyltransferase [Bradyrhizobium sp. 177]MCK1559700.1 acyltransferase [Bradyrhizobium sp. 171]MCK1592129.1 acyltransferase [Bradyrhizobium sp. 169]MCK1703658.1 acyltransferase [
MGSLRLFLALAVALSHFKIPLEMPTSDVAVQCFFVVSGFYMALVLNEKYPPGSYWLFISNRVLRLWPTYLMVLVASFGVARNWWPIASLDFISIAYFLVSQIFVVGQESYFFLFADHDALRFSLHAADTPTILFKFSPVPQAWTLALEIYFYLVAPFIVRRGPLVVGAAIVASILLRLTLLWGFDFGRDPWTCRFFPSELALFLAGSLGYYASASRGEAERKRANAGRLLLIIPLLAGLACSEWNGISRLMSLTILGAVIIGIPRLFELTRNIAWDRYLGELSYPLYICHFLVGWITLPETVASAYGSLALSLVVSMAFYRWVECPIDHWRQSRFERTRQATNRALLLKAVSSST